MRITISSYDSQWPIQFESLKRELKEALFSLKPQVEHIGSTSVPNLKAKPIIDILVGLEKESNLECSIRPLIESGYWYYEIFNSLMPYRRFFVKTKESCTHAPAVVKSIPEFPEELHEFKFAHIHVLTYNSFNWVRHIAFRDYLREHNQVKEEYENLKIQLGKREWKDGSEYNAAKDLFIKNKEAEAIKWYSCR